MSGRVPECAIVCVMGKELACRRWVKSAEVSVVESELDRECQIMVDIGRAFVWRLEQAEG